MIVFKKLSRKRAITIPKRIAAELGFDGGEAVDISETPDGGVLIRKHVPSCRFCGDKDNAKTYMGIDCCPECAEKLLKGVS